MLFRSTLFARVRVQGKLIRRSLETKALSIGRLRLAYLEKAERQSAEHGPECDGGKMTFCGALNIFFGCGLVALRNNRASPAPPCACL